MQANAAERIVNPIQWSYKQQYFGKEVNIVRYNSLIKRYMNQQQREQLEATCRITDHIAVSSGHLSRREREKHPDRRLLIGRHVFYLFKMREIPLEVYVKINPIEGVYIYDDGQSIED